MVFSGSQWFVLLSVSVLTSWSGPGLCRSCCWSTVEAVEASRSLWPTWPWSTTRSVPASVRTTGTEPPDARTQPSAPRSETLGLHPVVLSLDSAELEPDRAPDGRVEPETLEQIWTFPSWLCRLILLLLGDKEAEAAQTGADLQVQPAGAEAVRASGSLFVGVFLCLWGAAAAPTLPRLLCHYQRGRRRTVLPPLPPASLLHSLHLRQLG